MADNFLALVDMLDARDREKARSPARVRQQAPPPKPTPLSRDGGFEGILQKALQLRASLPPRDYGAELDSLMTKAMASFNAGTMTGLEVTKLEDMVERTRYDGVVKGKIR